MFHGSFCLISVFLMFSVGQPCQVDLDLAWLDVDWIFVCVFCYIVVIRHVGVFNAIPVV